MMRLPRSFVKGHNVGLLEPGTTDTCCLTTRLANAGGASVKTKQLIQIIHSLPGSLWFHIETPT